MIVATIVVARALIIITIMSTVACGCGISRRRVSCRRLVSHSMMGGMGVGQALVQ
jgi:hypothetical protein